MILKLHFFQWFAAIFSGVLMALSFTPWEVAALAWVAWLPLLSQLLPIDPSKKCEQPFRLGFGTGFVFWLFAIHWLHHVSLFGMIALAAYLALYFGIWAAILVFLRRHWVDAKGWVHLLIAFFGASAWVASEWIRGWMLGGFPWNFIATTQYENLVLIQIAEWTGVYGVSFVIIFFNVSLWLTWRRLKTEHFSAKGWRYEFSTAIFLVALCIFIGMRHLLRSQNAVQENAKRLKLVLIQPNIPQEVKYEALSRDEQRKRLRELTLTSKVVNPQLVVWPETALVDGPSYDASSRYWLLQLVREINIPILFGTLDRSLDSAYGKGRDLQQAKYYNAVVLVRPSNAFSPPYRKLHLVPFGEYVPFENWVPWLSRWIPIPGSFDSGKEPVLFDFEGFKIGPLICFEDTFPYLARNLTRENADILINFTNDAWFKTSPAAHMHAINAVFRAIETRRPLVRCTNNGETMVIDPNGQINKQQQLEPFRDGFLTISLGFQHQTAQTFFVRYGEWFPLLCATITIAGFAFLSYRSRMHFYRL